MVPILYATVTEGSVPTNYGIGPLTDTLSAEVTEERNGSYELRLEYAAQGIHAEDIQPNKIIKAKPNYTDDPQLFRIYKVGKTIKGKFEVNAQHISYDLSGKLITTGTAANCGAACALLQAAAGSFSITTDKSVSATFTVSQPSSVRSWFGGKEGSLLDVYGGEWAFDNYTASLKAARGANRGVQIRYGKNLTELSQVLDMSNLATAILPYYIDQEGNKTIGTKVSTGLVLDVPREIAIDFSNDVQPESSTPITTQLANLANRYKNNNNLTTLTNSITLDFVQSGELTERVDLCDEVSIYFEALGITATAKCVETVWDVLAERYTSTTFGEARTNIADTIAAAQITLEESASREAVSKATQLITGNLGGYVVLHDSDGDGQPDEILIMNTADISTATKVWRWNKNGLGYSSTGYAGSYGLAMTADGAIVADYIKTGVISDLANNSTINMTNGEATMKDFIAKNSLKFINNSDVVLIYMQPDANGGIMSVGDLNGLSLAHLMCDENGGLFYIRNKNNNATVAIRNDSSGRGNVYISNSNGDVVVDIIEGPSGAGELWIDDNTGSSSIWGLGITGQLFCTQLIQTSSRKVKENIRPFEDARKILDLDAVVFDYKDKAKGTDKRGFIAEDVAEVLPNLVTPETEKTPASLDYVGMVPYLQAVIKEQDKRIAALEEKLNNLGG